MALFIHRHPKGLSTGTRVSIYLTQIEVVDKPSNSRRPCDQLPARNRAPTGVWPPFSQLAAGWRLDWDPPSFAGPFFSIAVAIFVFQQVGSAAKVLDRELVSNRFY